MTSAQPAAVWYFAAGEGTLIVHPPSLAFVDPHDDDLADRLWERLAGADDVDGVLEELSTAGLRSIRSFVLAQFEGPDLRLFVRGEATVSFVGEEGPGQVDASGVRTWIEQLVRGPLSLTVRLPQAASSPSSLRVLSGVVRAAAVSWSGVELQPADAATVLSTQGGRHPPVGLPAPPSTVGSQVVDTLLPSADEGEPPASVEVISASDAGGSAVERSPGGLEDEDDIVDTGQTLLPGAIDEHLAAVDADPEARPEVPPGPHAVASAPMAEPEPQDDDDDYDYDALYGHTTHKSVQDAAVPSEEDADGPPTSTGPPAGLISAVPPAAGPHPAAEIADDSRDDLGDHDGMTMSVAQLRALRSAQAGESTAATIPPVAGGPTVQALVCSVGHPNPPTSERCGVCGEPLTGPPTLVARPDRGRIVLSNGEIVELTRPVILGRNPRVEGELYAELPAAIKVGGTKELSRSHAMIRLEGWQVLVEDLDSKNGTTVTLVGRAPRRLRRGEPMIIDHGAEIDLGGEVTGIYESPT